MKTFKEVYKMPFEKPDMTGWVYDQARNFCFQLNFINEEKEQKIIEVINGGTNLQNKGIHFYNNNGNIYNDKGAHVITIRGWGNSTSPNCFAFSDEEAYNIQDTLAEYIIERLNFRENA